MIKDTFCCSYCFENQYIKVYIENEFEEVGECPYCKKTSVKLISLRKLGIYMRKCLMKAYDSYDNGTGAYHDPDEKMYCGPDGKEAKIYSIREILTECEVILNDVTSETSLLTDLFDDLYSYREIQKGAYDQFSDIDSQEWVIKNDLYGSEQIRISHAWEIFKHISKHYSRYFDFAGFGFRGDCLERLDPYIYEFIVSVPKGTKLYRVRKTDGIKTQFCDIEPNNQLGSPPAVYAKTNRMSPAGIPYLYLSTDIVTAAKECRINENETVYIAEFVSTVELQILDISSNRFFSAGSIFDPQYDHDNRWMNDFWSGFIREVSETVSDDKQDHSYEYVATQLVAEYYRNKGNDGICFKSSVGLGKNYVFFFGPDPKYTKNAYPYPYNEIYFPYDLPILEPFTEFFQIKSIRRAIYKNNEVLEMEKRVF